MHAMAIGAHRDFGLALREQLPVHAGLVLAQLIGAEGRIVLPHEGSVGMAAPAQSWNLAPLDLSTEAGLLAHGLYVGPRRIAAMATRTSEPFL